MKTIESPLHRKSSRKAVKAIRREFARRREEIAAANPPVVGVKRGPLFYAIIILLLIPIGVGVVSRLDEGLPIWGKKRIDRRQLQVRKSIDALTVALGRYRFHVGEYPSTEEGLETLAKKSLIKRGWDGPYVNHIVDDPWGEAFVYERRAEGGNPVLYSKGPDRRAGTTDDVLPDQAKFDEPFRDTTWTNNWAPYRLRGVVVAPDEATKRRVQQEMKAYD